MRRLLSILVWSVIAAAFIGPGTVTTAASAGSRFGLRLLWALLFSTLACFVLQEAAARLAVVSGRDLGGALRHRYRSGAGRIVVLGLVSGAILLGCAAYEAGNILGGVAGAALALAWPPAALTALCGLVAAALLWFNRPRVVAMWLSGLVALMGVSFLWAAIALRPALGEVARGALTPALPAGSGVLALGLVGTTVVPYNLFLGSGLAGGQRLGEMRLGLAVAVGLGGLISAAVVIVGGAVAGDFSFAALAAVLGRRLGPWAERLFALGLLAAGLSSAITAPLAAALTARGLFARRTGDPRWGERSWRYRAVWLGVLGVGVLFGLSGVRPVPAIVVAQALNGVLLPLVAIFLLIAVNDRRLMGPERVNGRLANVLMAAVVVTTIALGARGLWGAVSEAARRLAAG